MVILLTVLLSNLLRSKDSFLFTTHNQTPPKFLDHLHLGGCNIFSLSVNVASITSMTLIIQDSGQ